MLRYRIERVFPDGLGLQPDKKGNEVACIVVGNNDEKGTT